MTLTESFGATVQNSIRLWKEAMVALVIDGKCPSCKKVYKRHIWLYRHMRDNH
jgi:hypothetical protein